MSIVVDVCGVVTKKGINVYFLNRSPALNVSSPKDIEHAFRAPPHGLTPIVPALRKIFSSHRHLPSDKKLLIFIATDGFCTHHLNLFMFY